MTFVYYFENYITDSKKMWTRHDKTDEQYKVDKNAQLTKIVGLFLIDVLFVKGGVLSVVYFKVNYCSKT